MDAWTTTDVADETVIGALRAAVAACPDRVFLDFSGDTYTYADVWRLSTDLARGLRRAGVGPGQTVVSLLDNNVDAVATWFASNLIGAIWVSANTALKGETLRHIVSDADTRVVVCEPDFVERFILVQDDLPGVELFYRGAEQTFDSALKLRNEPVDRYRLPGADEDWFAPTPNDVSLLIYTGGTTGPSKGGIMSHGYAVNIARRTNETTGRRADEVNWSPLPIYHMNAVSCTVLGTMLLQGSASIYRRFSVSNFWPEIERTGATIVNLVGAMPAMLARMDDTPEMARCRGQVRCLYAAPVSPDDQQIWRERFGATITSACSYGLGEVFPITMLAVEGATPPGTSGKANAGDFDVRIFDDDDRELGPNEVGEVVCRPRRPNVMFQGYWRRPETTVSTMRNLWFHTGDLGKFDDEGYFYFVDRKKDYLRRSGENISSQEQESMYLSHPDIAEVAVHAVLSDLAEDDVKVTAVLRDGATLTPEALFEWAKERVPYFALPRYIEFRAELPKSVLNRVHKYQLRDEGRTPSTWDREDADVTWERR